MLKGILFLLLGPLTGQNTFNSKYIDQESYQTLFHLNATAAARIATLLPRQQVLLTQPHVTKVLNLHVDPTSAALFSAARRA